MLRARVLRAVAFALFACSASTPARPPAPASFALTAGVVAHWTQAGPSGASIQALAMKPGDETVALAIVPSGLLPTSDTGAHCTPVRAPIESPLDVHFSAAAAWLSGYDGLAKSTDASIAYLTVFGGILYATAS